MGERPVESLPTSAMHLLAAIAPAPTAVRVRFVKRFLRRPGHQVRLLLLDYFEGLESGCGIASRTQGSLSVRRCGSGGSTNMVRGGALREEQLSPSRDSHVSS